MNRSKLKIDRHVASGAAGSIYLAHDTGTSQKFALKVLKDLSPVSLANFEREVLFLSRLKHPGLVAIHGFSKTGEEIENLEPGPCYWMDFVEGEPIGPTPDTETATRWLTEALEALAYLHGEGILHGDLKPANILVDRSGHAKLLDFGLASVVGGGPTVGKLRGSLPYLAPESLQGERTPASDLYSLGTIFYELIVGQHPRPGARNLAELFAPEFPRLEASGLKIPKRFARIVDRMIATDRSERFKSAADILAALRDDSELTSPPPLMRNLFV